ncbi:aspartic peptidase domain-containing protein [Pilobolus umbonatus]|nr:aspartic peptidase domain-containing protein [Pilobolus umbonatus]
MHYLPLTIYAFSLLSLVHSAAIKRPLQMNLYHMKQTHLFKRNHLHSMSTPLLNDIDTSELVVKVKVGTPAKEFLLLFDTGGADSWIPSVECGEDTGCPAMLNRYNLTESSTYIPLDDDFNVSYEIGNAIGSYFMDVVSLENGYTLNRQVMGLVTSNEGAIAQQTKENDIDDIIIDGIFGAGLSAGTARYQTDKDKAFDPFPISLYRQGFIPEPLFSVYIGDYSNHHPGKVIMGGIDCDKIKGKIIYSDLVESSPSVYSRWTIPIRGFQLNNGTVTNFKFTQMTAFEIDTGSNFMYLPGPLAAEIARYIDPDFKIEENGVNISVDCEYLNSTVDFNIYLSHKEDEDPLKSMISVPVSKLIAQRSSDNKCLLLFTPSKDKFILGNMFLRHFVTVYDFGKHRIGFGALS